MWTNILMAIIGLACGFAVASGIFAFILSLGIVERMADVTHTAKHLKTYETIIFFGASLGNILSVYNFNINIGKTGVATFGLFSGVFVGIMAIALVEILKSIPIMFRRANIRKGLGVVVLSIALGKAFGSLLQFWMGWTS